LNAAIVFPRIIYFSFGYLNYKQSGETLQRTTRFLFFVACRNYNFFGSARKLPGFFVRVQFRAARQRILDRKESFRRKVEVARTNNVAQDSAFDNH